MSITLQHQDTPSKSIGFAKIYPKSDNKLYMMTSDGIEIEIASSATAGTPSGDIGSIQYNNDGLFDGFGSWDGTTATINAINTTSIDNSAGDLVIKREGVTKFTLGDTLATFHTGSVAFGSTTTIALAGSNSFYRDIGYVNLLCYKGADDYRTVVQNPIEYEDVVSNSASDQTGITTATQLFNNNLGASSYNGQLRNYTYLWDTSTNRIIADSNFKVGDIIDIDFGCVVNCSVANTALQIQIRGYNNAGTLIFTKTIANPIIKSSGTDTQVNRTTFIFIGPAIGDDGYFEFWGVADSATAFKSKSFVLKYNRVAR